MGRPPGGDVVDLLEYEDRVLLELLDDFDSSAGRREPRNAISRCLAEHLEARETAKGLIADALEIQGLEPEVVEELRANDVSLRAGLVRLVAMTRAAGERVARPVPFEDLETVVTRVAVIVRSEAPRELERLLPALRRRKVQVPPARVPDEAVGWRSAARPVGLAGGLPRAPAGRRRPPATRAWARAVWIRLGVRPRG
jgi:hypothetical protein